MISLLITLAVLSSAPRGQEPPKGRETAALQVVFELGSDFASADSSFRTETFNLVDKQQRLWSTEMGLGDVLFLGDPDSHYRSLVSAQSTQALDYLRAIETSSARFKSAQAAGDAEWSAKQLKAAQEYAALAANALIAEAQSNDGDAARLRASPFAMRRSPEQQAAFVEKFKMNGFSTEHRKLMHDTGFSDADIEEIQKELLQKPPERIGRSVVEWLSEIAAGRRDLAKQLNTFAQAGPSVVAGQGTQTFEVGNPHDKEETIDLFIRPVSIPPDWKLSVTDAEEQPKFKVTEVEQGRHYAVTLPAKAQVKVASVVHPVGEVGTNTTARWAVEGKIGDELIGGMVHEMNVPYIIADLKLPAVGSKEVEEELPAPSKPWVRLAVEVAAGIIILALFVYFFIFWRKRRQANRA